MLLSPLGERLGEGVMQEETFVLTPSPNLSPKAERNLKNEETMLLPLDGIRVIEVGQALAGPLAGVLLADMGADVIKIEKPDGGDDARIWGPPFGPDGVTSLYFYSQNRNKRSVALDLKAAADVEKLHRLCETADILIQNLRPGVVDEIGIGPESILKRHPRL